MKRPRASTGGDATLIEIYEDLAHEDERVRLTAAHALLTRYAPSADEDQTKAILTRLFRGLCSGRKAARPGFALALTEMLAQVKGTLSTSHIVNILNQQTKPESNTTGQDERDHYFGRLFGSEAIMESEILFTSEDADQWDRLLDIVCTIALRKPWLRQACGWTLYQCVRKSLRGDTRRQFAIKILDKMTEHKLIRTPEGLAIWIEVRRLHPEAKLPKHIWKHNDPFSKSDLLTLANVLKDAKVTSATEDEFQVQGSAVWAVNLHFVWDIVLPELLVEADEPSTKQQELVERFWQVAVDEALFAPANSQERKHWGLLVMQKALERAPFALIRVIFSKNAVACLVQSLKAADRYLQRSAQTVVQTLQKCVAKRPTEGAIYIICLLRAAGMVDFDLVTGTKTIQGLLVLCGPDALLDLAVGFSHDLAKTNPSDAVEAMRRRRIVLNYESKIIFQQVNQALQRANPLNQEATSTILHNWIKLVSGKPQLDEAAKKLTLEKVRLAFEHLLKLGRHGHQLILDLIGDIQAETPANSLEAESDIIDFINAGWKRFGKLRKLADNDIKSTNGTGNAEARPKPKKISAEKAEGLTLLYGLILFEIHTGDTEAIQILRELLDFEAENLVKNKTSDDVVLENTDELIEILLSFASRPSKFLRRMTLTIFGTFTSQITRDGLQSLTDILEAKETKAGQQELFEANGDVDMGEDEEDEEDSDVETLDSDVEIVSASASDSNETSETETTDEDEDESEDDSDTETKDTELFALEASLASALGTRKLTEADAASSMSDSDSDSDMTDSEMMALDNKLAEVFRHRVNASNESKKKERKTAKENIVNFKNRVLDMLEVYVKQEYLNSRCLDLLLPLLHLARQTNTKQLAEKTVKLMQLYSKRCAGLDKVPNLPPVNVVDEASSKDHESPTKRSNKHKKAQTSPPPNSDTSDKEEPSSEFTIPETLALLHEIHTELTLPNTSNLHRSACSRASILLIKTLLKAGIDIHDLEAVYNETRKTLIGNMDTSINADRKVEEMAMSKAQREFFEDWRNWRVSVEGRIGR